MKCNLVFLGIISLFGHIVCPPHKDGNGMLCYHCGGRGHDHFPACLSETHHCNDDEKCMVKDHDGHFTSECWTPHDCAHISHCTLNKHTGHCTTCCSDKHCLDLQLASFQGLSLATTTHKHVEPATHPVTMTPSTMSTTPMSAMEKLMLGVCKDDVENDGCKTLGSAFCADHVGITLCPETCGLCTTLQNRFHGNTTCHDTLLDSACAIENTPDFCQSAVGELACPLTCNLCYNIVNTMIQNIIDASKTTTSAPTTHPTIKPTTKAATSEAVTRMETTTQPVTTLDPCHDDFDHCTTTSGICSNTLGPSICRKTCGVCGDGPVVINVTQGTTYLPTTEASTASLSPMELLKAGVCLDSVAQSGCNNTEVYCQDAVGVSLCPLTCGLCSRLEEKFQGTTACQDQLKDLCTVDVCPVSLGKCPKTCGQCNEIITYLIKTIVDDNQTTLPPRTTATTQATTATMSTTNVIPTSTTTKKTTVPMATVASCHNRLDNCNTLDDICNNPIGPNICQKFCNLCDAGNHGTTGAATSPVSPLAAATSTQMVGTATPAAAFQCHQCGDIDSGAYCEGLEAVLPPAKDCPAGSHYCITDLILDAQESPRFIRRCATRARCSKDWWASTSSDPVCIDSDPTQLHLDKTCSYCCTGDKCNHGDIPEKSTFFKP